MASRHSKGDGSPRRHAKLPVWVMWLGLVLLTLSFVSGAIIWWGQTVETGLDGAGSDSLLLSGHWRRLHGALNPFLWGFLGYLTHQHIRVGWRDRACLFSGGAMLFVLAGLAVSGTYLVYGGGEIDRGSVVGFHRSLGLSLPVVLMAHWIEALVWVRRIEQRASGQAEPPGRQRESGPESS